MDSRQAKPKKKNARGTGTVDTCWWILIPAGLAALIAGSSTTNSGFFYVAFMDYFDISREKASWPSSFVTPIANMAGMNKSRMSFYVVF